MNQDELMHSMEEIFSMCIRLARKKNSDYASDSDALENFRSFGRDGIIVRLGDKFTRLRNVYKRGNVVDETLEDTLLDIINYSAIAIIMGEGNGNA